MNITIYLNKSQLKVIMSGLLCVLAVFSICSCEDKPMLESRLEVKVVPMTSSTTGSPSTGASSEEMTKEFYSTQFSEIKSEEAVNSAIEQTNLPSKSN